MLFRSYTQQEFTELLTESFLTWIGNNREDYASNRYFDKQDPFTWNYSRLLGQDGKILPGHWRAIYKFYYDTDRPHLAPWEMLGFSEQPQWWQDAYGPAPYTGGNTVLWNDLEAGRILQGTRAGVDKRFARPGLTMMIPVDETGHLKPPSSFLVKNFNASFIDAGFVIGDQGPVETAWRRSSDFPFAMQLALLLARPASYLGTLFDNSRYNYDLELKQITFSGTRQRLVPSQLIVPDAGLNPTSPGIKLTAGYGNWVRDYLVQQGIDGSSKMRDYFNKLAVRLSYKVAGFTSQNQLLIVATQSSPGGSGNNIVVPNENYIIHLNKSAPTKRVIYSAVTIESVPQGYRLSGYDAIKPYFTIIPGKPSNNSFSLKEAGITVVINRDTDGISQDVPYGTIFETVQDVADFLYDYQRYLVTLGFEFEEYNKDLNVIQDWVLSIREFMTWSKQGWQDGNIIILSPVSSKISIRTTIGVIDEITTNHAPQWKHAIGDAFGKVEHVRHHAIVIGSKGLPHAAKPSDHLVKNQQNAVLVANLAQTLVIALGRNVPTRTTRHGLDNDGRHIAGVVQGQNALLEIEQKVFVALRLGVVNIGVLGVMNEAHVVDTRQHGSAKHFAVARYAAHAHAPKTDAVIATLAADEDVAVAFATDAVIGQGHFQGRVGRLGARVAKQHLVQVTRCQLGDHFGGLKGLVVAGLKSGAVIECVELAFDGFVDRAAVVARPDTPQARDAIDDLTPVMGCEVHAVGLDEHPRLFAKMSVARERQPLVIEVDAKLSRRTLRLGSKIVVSHGRASSLGRRIIFTPKDRF